MGALQAGGKRQTEKVLQTHAEALKGWLPPSELCPAFTAEDLDFLEVRCSEIYGDIGRYRTSTSSR